jgi:hypothetical protein
MVTVLTLIGRSARVAATSWCRRNGAGRKPSLAAFRQSCRRQSSIQRDAAVRNATMQVRRTPRTIDRWQDEHGADNFSEVVRQIIDAVQPGKIM